MSDPELILPSAEDQSRLKAEWLEICQRLGASPSTFRLEFGERFDCGFCILRSGDGWMVLDILRGNEESRRFLPSDDDLLYESAKAATFAMAGWDREKNESRFSRALGALFHYLDPKLDTRLQGRQQLRQVQRRQLRLMQKIRPDWALRLASDQSGSRSARNARRD